MRTFSWKVAPPINGPLFGARLAERDTRAAMGPDLRPQEKRALGSFRKVSKPLMEKKRRARINVSLEQLRALLEKHYSHQIRKRKLEKADILELSVKYIRSLQQQQHSIPGAPPPPPPGMKSADYQAGFRSCLQGVRHFLLRSESEAASSSSSSSCFQLLHELARALPAGASGGGLFSTTDSGCRPAPRKPPPPPLLRGKVRARGREEDSIPTTGAAAAAGRGQASGERRQPLPPLWRPW